MRKNVLLKRGLAFGCFALALAFSAAGAEPLPKLPADAFFAPASFASPKLSPGGTKLCALTRFDDRHYALTLIDLESKQVQTLIKAETLTTLFFWWKSDDLLLAILEGDGGRRIYQAVDLKSKKIYKLDDLENYHWFNFMSDLPDDPDQMLFSVIDVSAVEIIKVNLRNGQSTHVEVAPSDVSGWCVNRLGQALAGYGFDSNKQRWFITWRTGPGAKWQRKDAPEKQVPDIVPFAVAPDQHRIIATSYEHSPMGSICYFDPVSGKTEELLASAEVEPTRFLTTGNHMQIVGVDFETDHSTLRFFDPKLDQANEWIEKALPGTWRAFASFSRDQTKSIVYAEADRNAGIFCLADLPAKKITVLRSSMSGLKPTQMGESRHFNFTTSDHLVISGRITLPPGLEKPPLIFFIGPNLNGPRSSMTFDATAQFFASRGYAFARVNHRGTEGFGRRFAEAGDFQVTTGMVSDLIEGKDWLSHQGWIDGARVAVIGEQWGGLVAFQLALKADLVRALVNIETPVGVTNYSHGNAFMTSQRDPEEVVKLIGGFTVFHDYKNAINPVTVAEKLSIPSFHFYSKFENGDNVETRAAEAQSLEAALKKRGAYFEFLYGDAVSKKTSVQTTDWRQAAKRYEAIAAFLERNL